LTPSNDLTSLVFKLYSGVDRSYNQFTNPHVVFSREFDNILNSEYSKSKTQFKNLTVVAGEGEGLARKTKVVGSGVGISRREMYTDARDLSQTTESGSLTDEVYYAQLEQRGLEDLAENKIENKFDNQVDVSGIFKYGEDFFLGDIVQIVSEYGVEARARVTEIIRSQNSSGISIYPTFKILD